MTTLRKLAYGFGDSGFSVTSTALALLYLDFLINVVGLNAHHRIAQSRFPHREGHLSTYVDAD